MSDQAMLDQFMVNWQQYPSAEFDTRYHVLEPSCYEVIRLMGGRPLFLNDESAVAVKVEIIIQTPA